MRNFIQPGHTVTVTAPSGGILSGAGLLTGALFGIAATTAAAGEEVEVDTVGVFDLPKAASQAWTVGQKVYWDDTAKVCTTTATSNSLIGLAMVAVGAGADETMGRVRLNGISV
jgi:predicted RecA/RadA family phage recombinase